MRIIGLKIWQSENCWTNVISYYAHQRIMGQTVVVGKTRLHDIRNSHAHMYLNLYKKPYVYETIICDDESRESRGACLEQTFPLTKYYD